jgi:single-stranded DNA-binding protein
MDRGVNHCLLEAEVLEAPQIRYTQDSQTPIAEMTVQVEGLRPDDPPSALKVVGWGNLAQDLQNRVRVGQKLVLEGRMRMNTVARQDGVKEKRAELTLARLHPLSADAAHQPGLAASSSAAVDGGVSPRAAQASPQPTAAASARRAPAPNRMEPPQPPVWNSAPLVPADDLVDEDDIPF